MLKTLMITTAISGLMIGAAMAEGSSPPASTQPPASQMQPAKPDTSSVAPATRGAAQFINSQKPDQWLASKFRGTDVVGSDNLKIGNVSDLLFDRNGKVEAYVISIGGFLGVGAKDVALAPSSFQVVAGDKSKNEFDKLKDRKSTRLNSSHRL